MLKIVYPILTTGVWWILTCKPMKEYWYPLRLLHSSDVWGPTPHGQRIWHAALRDLRIARHKRFSLFTLQAGLQLLVSIRVQEVQFRKIRADHPGCPELRFRGQELALKLLSTVQSGMNVSL